MRKALGFGTGFGVLMTATMAFAQQPPPTEPPPPPPATTTELPPAKPAATVSGSTTTPAAKADDKKDDGITDHEKVVGKLGVMYFGVTEQPIGLGPNTNITATSGGAVGRGNVQTPVIGVRYWLRERLGLDLGLGFNFFSSATSAKANNVETTVDGPAVMAFMVHGGVPLAFAYGKHYKFLLVPELNVGYATQTAAAQGVPPGAQPISDLHLSGFRLDVGARIGTEIQFGFIGIPELALQASVGLNFRHRIWSASQGASPPATPADLSASDHQTDLGTTVQSDPWALFVNNVSAIYYFP
jgi:hypothetical protein